MSLASFANAESVKHPGCTVILDSPVKTASVEQGHVIDACLSDSTQQIDRVIIGNSADWSFKVGSTKDIVYVTSDTSNGGTNMLIYLKGETKVRYELRLRAQTMLPH